MCEESYRRKLKKLRRGGGSARTCRSGVKKEKRPPPPPPRPLAGSRRAWAGRGGLRAARAAGGAAPPGNGLPLRPDINGRLNLFWSREKNVTKNGRKEHRGTKNNGIAAVRVMALPHCPLSSGSMFRYAAGGTIPGCRLREKKRKQKRQRGKDKSTKIYRCHFVWTVFRDYLFTTLIQRPPTSFTQRKVTSRTLHISPSPSRGGMFGCHRYEKLCPSWTFVSCTTHSTYNDHGDVCPALMFASRSKPTYRMLRNIPYLDDFPSPTTPRPRGCRNPMTRFLQALDENGSNGAIFGIVASV